jgi:hypothetical protein
MRKNAMSHTKSKGAAPKRVEAPSSDESPLISATEWRKKNGNITARTQYNWEEKGIIPAAVRINGRKYHRAGMRPQFDGATS